MASNYSTSTSVAESVPFDNTGTSFTATNVETAIKETLTLAAFGNIDGGSAYSVYGGVPIIINCGGA